MPPESSTPTGTSATIRRSTATRRLSSSACLPVLLGPVRAVRVTTERRAPSRRWSVWRPSGSTTRTVAGGSFRIPFRMVRGAGTTLWKVM